MNNPVSTTQIPKIEFKVQIMYLDGTPLVIEVEAIHLDNFLQCLSKQQLYWSEDRSNAFFTDLNKVRYFTLTRKPIEPNQGIILNEKDSTSEAKDTKEDQ